MNKQELIDAVAMVSDLPKKTAKLAVESVTAVIEAHLSGGNDVTITGFGSFITKQRSARIGRNPSTGKAVDIPATRVVRFTPGKQLKDAVKSGQ